MTRSANEVMGLATKAARGAGAPPAQAAQFGAAVVVYLNAAHPLDVLNSALAALPAGPIMDIPLALARLAEQADDGRASGMITGFDASLLQSYVGALPFAAEFDAAGVTRIDLNQPSARGHPHRIDLPDGCYAHWSDLGARLLVPESDASRLAGAGAGLSDND
ncbi:hypothetical protein [uncultured Sulfitobacter sp.]|uniref:hypothetical protein n=1 Tax=uncultured Sulfitobacter sp. TaxID=191468 RepID=UPI00260A2761|nr:hypothetical protein [uncultured Sulfitobacter sp.]